MIYNLRGTNGSGKSHCVHELLKKYKHEELWDPNIDEQVGIVIPDLSLRLVGDYSTQCGGGDWYIAGRSGSKKSIQHLADLVDQLLIDWHPRSVLVECFMVSGTFGRWNDQAAKHAQEYGSLLPDGKRAEVWKMLFLDTPKEVCADRIRSRRERRATEMGKDPKSLPEFNPKNCYDQHRQGLNIRKNMQAAGRNVIDLPYLTAPEVFIRMVEEDAAKL